MGVIEPLLVQNAPGPIIHHKEIPVAEISQTRREAIKLGTGGVATALAYLSIPDFVFPGHNQDEELVPFLDMPRTPPNRLDCETLDS